jgi:hypothetical protein
MSIGGSIFLLATGLILALAINVTPTPAGAVVIEWNVVGWILVCAGLLGLALSFYLMRRTVVVRRDVPPVVTTVVDEDLYPPVR